VFDLLLGTLFGDLEAFERQMLDPSAEVLERAKAVGQRIALVSAVLRGPCKVPDGCKDRRINASGMAAMLGAAVGLFFMISEGQII
jgi:hypothetical protein